MSHSEGSTDRLYSSCKNLVTLSTSKLPETWFKACSSTVFDSVTVWLIHVKAKKDINNWYWASNPVFYFIQTAYFSLSGLFHLCRYPTHLLLWFLWGVTAYIILLHVSVKRLIPKVQIHVWKTKDAWKTSQRVYKQMYDLDECIKRSERRNDLSPLYTGAGERQTPRTRSGWKHNISTPYDAEQNGFGGGQRISSCAPSLAEWNNGTVPSYQRATSERHLTEPLLMTSHRC